MSLLLDNFQFLVKFINFYIAVVDFFCCHLFIISKRQLGKKLFSKFLSLDTELI